jgi:ubiquitin carboxyl-terminal hydrolase 16/45
MNDRKTGCVNPRELFSKICGKWQIYSGFQQQDSHELLRRLLDELREEHYRCLNGNRQEHANRSLMDDVFQGKLTSLIKCDVCGYVSPTPSHLV